MLKFLGDTTGLIIFFVLVIFGPQIMQALGGAM